MAEEHINPIAEDSGQAETAASESRADSAGAGGVRWSELWQMPVLIVSVILLVVGWYMAAPKKPVVDYGAKLIEASKLIQQDQCDRANVVLDGVLQHYDELSAAQKIQYHLERGDAFVEGMKTKGQHNPANHQKVIEHYTAAEKLGSKLDDGRKHALAASYLALGQTDQAEALTKALSKDKQEDAEQLRVEAIRVLVADPARYDEATRKLSEMLDDQSVSRERRIWAVGQLAKLRMRGGQMTAPDAGEAANLLVRWLIRLDAATNTDTAPLRVTLGQAYLKLGNRDKAEEQFRLAQQAIPSSDPVAGETLVGLGQVSFEQDNITEAEARFEEAVNRYPDTPCYFDALIGLAESQVRLEGGWQASLETFSKAIALAQAGKVDMIKFKTLADSLAQQRQWRYDKHDYAVALEYSKLEMKLYGDNPPEGVVLKTANEHEQLARQMLGLGDGEAATSVQYQKLDPTQRGEVSNHYEQAADLYARHAAMVAQVDDPVYGESLWRSADCYDKAGMRARAIEQFNKYLATRGEDPRQLQVRFRLAQAYQADAQFDHAIDLYRKLIENHPKSPEAYDALVPLARCYLAKGLDSWNQAEQVLLSVVTNNEALRPESRQYRVALIELGKLYYRRGDEGDYERAIERLSEATKRYGTDDQLPELEFQLGDAYRKSVQQIDKRLAEPQAPSQRAKYQQERATRLADAQQAFDHVIAAYEKIGASKLTPLRKLYLRNSYFYRADCAYNLRHYEGTDGAIALYDQAAGKYENDPSVLIAMIQIVNSYCELGQWDLARTANERARWYLARIKDEAFNDPNLPMTRKDWQRWLDWTSELNAQRGASANVSQPATVP